MPIVLSVITFIIVIVCLLIPKTKNSKIITLFKNYNLCSLVSDEDVINIDVYVNDKKTYITDKKQIISSYITDMNNDSVIELDLVGIYKTNEYINYQKDKFYLYTFQYKINFKTDTYIEWYIENALLEINYIDNIEYNLKIGNFSFIKLELANEQLISISSIKPLTSNIKNNTYLTGVVIGVRNLYNDELNIKEINILNCGMGIGNNILEIPALPQGNNFDIIAGYDYSLINKGSNEVNITVNDEIKYLLIPFYYDKLLIVEECPIAIKILKNDTESVFYINDYIYYEPFEEVVKIDDISIYDVI